MERGARPWDGLEMKRPAAIVALVLALSQAACAAAAAADDAPCSARGLKLGDAKRLTAVAGQCTPRHPGDAPLVIRDKAALAEKLDCPAGPPPVDFDRQALIVVSRVLSPATVGIDAFDDGKVVTLVTRARRPCPDDPRPMPTPATYLFVIAAPAARTFAEASCTATSRCR